MILAHIPKMHESSLTSHYIQVSVNIAASFFCKFNTAIYNASIYDLSDEWYSSDETVYSLDCLPEGDVTLTHSLKKIDLHRMRLCFESTDTHIIAEFDGDVVYTYAPKQASVLGRSYGSYIHLIPIPPDADSVTLQLHPI